LKPKFSFSHFRENLFSFLRKFIFVFAKIFKRKYTKITKIGVFGFCENFRQKRQDFRENFREYRGFWFSRKLYEIFKKTKIFRETKFREISRKSAHFRMIFAFSRKRKNAFSFQPYLVLITKSRTFQTSHF
jgi:hypothetical protein